MEERKQKFREAAQRLRELEQQGATLDDILNGPEGYVWIEEACGGDRELAEEAFLIVPPHGALPQVRRVETKPGNSIPLSRGKSMQPD